MSSHWLVILRTIDPSFRQVSCNSVRNEVKCKTYNDMRCWHDFATQNVIILLITIAVLQRLQVLVEKTWTTVTLGLLSPTRSSSIQTMIEVHSMGNTVPKQRRGVQKRRHADRQSGGKLQRLVQSPGVQRMSRGDRRGLHKLRVWKKPLPTLPIPSMRCLWTRRSKLPCTCQRVGLR